MTGVPRSARRAAQACRAAAAATDLLPASIRYGRLRSVTRVLFPSRMTVLPLQAGAPEVAEVRTLARDEAQVRCLLVTGGLDVGGVESVVATLATGLRRYGLATSVACTEVGAVGERLRAAGVVVTAVRSGSDLAALVARSRAAVIEVHGAPPEWSVALPPGVPSVPVVHNMEIHRTQAEWDAVGRLAARSRVTIAVSEVTGRHHQAHVPGLRLEDVVVVPNGAAELPGTLTRSQARVCLAELLGTDLAGDVVVLCLARYDAQKNVPGLVRALGRAMSGDRSLRLVVAGSVADPLERLWADAERRATPFPDRIHLLGPSDGPALLTAADVFVLDSFFEGWPVAATEAAVAGLGLVLSDAGGSAELAQIVPGARIVPNAVGPAHEVDERRVRRARRARVQQNERELVEALLAAADDVRTKQVPRRAHARHVAHGLRSEAMIAAHAAILHAEAHAATAAAGRTETPL